MAESTLLRSLFGGAGPRRTPMAHRVEWWPFGTVIRRASGTFVYTVKAMYIGDGSAITIDSRHDVISVNPDDWVSVPETGS